MVNQIKKILNFCFLSFLIFFSTFSKLSAENIDWIEVAKTDNEIQFIDTNSIKYNNSGFLSVITKLSEINPENHETLNSNIFLMAVDCENRLFNRLPLNGELKQVENWESPTNDRLTKKTILNTCSY